MHCWLSCLDFGMARDVSEDYYITSGSQIPIKWHTLYMHILTTFDLNRHCTSASTQIKVMSGALHVHCMRYGVLDIDHLEALLGLRLCNILYRGYVIFYINTKLTLYYSIWRRSWMAIDYHHLQVVLGRSIIS